jgi:hypothetical protein
MGSIKIEIDNGRDKGMKLADFGRKFGLENKVIYDAAARVRNLLHQDGKDLPEEALVLAARGVIRDRKHAHEERMLKLEQQLAALEGRKVFRPKAFRGGWE